MYVLRRLAIDKSIMSVCSKVPYSAVYVSHGLSISSRLSSHYFIGNLFYKTVEDWRYCYVC